MNILSAISTYRRDRRAALVLAMVSLVLSVLLSARSAFANEGAHVTMSLDQVIRTSLANDPGIKQAEAVVQAAKARLLQYKTGYYPSLTLDLEYSHVSPNTSVSVPDIGSFTSEPDNNYDYHVSVNQELFSFGRAHAKVSAGKWEVKAAESDLDMARKQVEFEAVQLFYRILLLQQELASQDENIRTLKDYLEVTKIKAGIGVATDFDSLTIQVKLSEAQSVSVNDYAELNKSRIDLARLLGLENAAQLEISGDLIPETNMPGAQDLVPFGLLHNPELQAATAQEQRRSADSRAAARGYFPSLGAGFQYGKKNGYFPEVDQLTWNSLGFIQLKMPLFDLAVIGRRKEAAADHKAAVEVRRDMQAKIAADIERGLSDLDAGKAKVDAEKIHLTLAEKAAEQAKVRYEGGIITSLDLLNVQADLSRARTLYAQSIYELIIDQASLKKAAGISLYAGAGSGHAQ